MITTRRPSPVNFSAPLVLDPPRHCGLSSIALIPGRHLIGSAPDCGICLPVDGVQQRHAIILVGENRTVLKAMDTRTWVNDGPVAEMALRNGDRLSIGPLTFRVRLATPEEAAAFVMPAGTAASQLEVTPERISNVRSARVTREITEEPLFAHTKPVDLPTTCRDSNEKNSVESTSAAPIPPKELQPSPLPSVPLESAQELAPPPAAPREINEPAAQFSASESQAPANTEIVQELTGPIDQPNAATTGKTEYVSTDRTPIEDKPHPSDLMNSRLDDIQKQLNELLSTAEFAHRRPTSNRLSPCAAVEVGNAEPQIREDDLQRRASEIDSQARQLHVRSLELAERESQLERQQESLVLETERLAKVAEAARLHVLQEQERLSSQWKEWDQTYLVTTTELANQSELVERQRTELRVEADRISAMRAELLRLRADCDQDRRTNYAERARLAVESAELQGLKTQLESERRQMSRGIDELEVKAAADRRALAQDHERLSAERRELEHSKTLLEEERSALARRTAEESNAREEERAVLEADRKRLMVERQELEFLRSNLDHSTHQASAESLEVDDLRRELHEGQCRLETERQELNALRSNFDRESHQLSSERDDIESLRRELEEQRSRLAIERQELDSLRSDNAVQETRQSPTERQELDSLRHELSELRNTLRSERSQQSQISALLGAPPAPQLIQPVENPVVFEFFGSPAESHGNAVAPERTTEPSSPNESTSDQYLRQSPDEHPGLWSFDPPTAEIAEPVRSLVSCMPPTSNEGSDWPSFSTDTRGFNTAPDFDAVGDVPTSFEGSTDVVSSAFGTITPDNNPTDALNLEGQLARLERCIPAAASSFGAEAWKYDAPQAHWASPPPLPPDQLGSTPWMSDPTYDVANTLAAVSDQFGTPTQIEDSREFEVDSASSTEPPPLPAWWKSEPIAKDAAPSPAAFIETSEPLIDYAGATPIESLLSKLHSDVKPTPAEPNEDLRSQLAKMFDLPPDATPNDSGPEETDTDLVENVAPTPKPELIKEVLKAEAPSKPAARDPEEPAVEDSVEAFMARLLARSRGDAEAMVPAAAPPPVPTSVLSSPGSDRPTAVQENIEGTSGDRSHLMAEPKHKQNKNAVRENLQSFRQVAHLSARSALARHSMRQLRNATIAKGALLGASLAAATFFMAEPMFGSEMELWKASGCWVAALLAGLEFRRSWNQLKRPAQHPLPEAAAAETSVEPSEVEMESPSVIPLAKQSNNSPE